MIKVLFFAQTKDELDCESLSLDGVFKNVAELRAHLQKQGENWQKQLSSRRTIVAVNQAMTDESQLLKSGDEVAFFPPVTGG